MGLTPQLRKNHVSAPSQQQTRQRKCGFSPKNRTRRHVKRLPGAFFRNCGNTRKKIIRTGRPDAISPRNLHVLPDFPQAKSVFACGICIVYLTLRKSKSHAFGLQAKLDKLQHLHQMAHGFPVTMLVSELQ